MKRRPHLGLLIAVIFLASTVSCIQEASADVPIVTAAMSVTPAHQGPIATQSEIPISDETPRPTTTYRPPASATPVSTPPLPDFLRGDFIFGVSSPDCELLCWQGLVVGASDLDDVRWVFQTAFGYKASVDIVALLAPRSSSVKSSLFPAEIAIVQAWGPGESEPSELYHVMDFRIDGDTGVLKAITFQGVGPVNVSPQRVIRELGPPFHMSISLTPMQAEPSAALALELIYDSGMVFFYHDVVPVGVQIHGRQVRLAEICMARDLNLSTFTIMEPVSDGLDNLTRYQERVLEGNNPYGNLAPFELRTGIPIDELAHRLIQEEDVCLYTHVRL